MFSGTGLQLVEPDHHFLTLPCDQASLMYLHWHPELSFWFSQTGREAAGAAVRSRERTEAGHFVKS